MNRCMFPDRTLTKNPIILNNKNAFTRSIEEHLNLAS